MLKFIRSYRKYGCRTAYVIAASLLFFMTALAFAQLIARYWFKTNFLWGNEVTIFCLTYIIAIATPMLYLEHDYVIMDLLSGKLSKKADACNMIAVDAVTVIVAVILTWSGIKAALLHRGFHTSYLGYDESVRYYFVIVLGVLLAFNAAMCLIERILLHAKEKGAAE